MRCSLYGVAEEVESTLASTGAPPVERYTHEHSMLLLEAAQEKARRMHRPLIITSLSLPADDPTQIHMDGSLLSALNMQVCMCHAFSLCMGCCCNLAMYMLSIGASSSLSSLS